MRSRGRRVSVQTSRSHFDELPHNLTCTCTSLRGEHLQHEPLLSAEFHAEIVCPNFSLDVGSHGIHYARRTKEVKGMMNEQEMIVFQSIASSLERIAVQFEAGSTPERNLSDVLFDSSTLEVLGRFHALVLRPTSVLSRL